VLDIRELNSTGQTVATESLTYGENRSITEKMQISEQSAEQPTGTPEDALYNQAKAEFSASIGNAITAQLEQGVDSAALLDGLNGAFEQHLEQLKDPGLTQEQRDRIDAYLDVVEEQTEKLKARVQEQTQKVEAEASARQAVEAAHSSASSEQNPAEKYQIPEGSTFVNSYQDAENNTWVEFRDANGVQRQVMQKTSK
jgi:hypothetical protein